MNNPTSNIITYSNNISVEKQNSLNMINDTFAVKFPDIIKNDYQKILRNSKPVVVRSIKLPPKGVLGAPTQIENNIPPLNTDITFAKTIPSFSIKNHPGLSAITTVPASFNWCITESSDSSDIKKRKN